MLHAWEKYGYEMAEKEFVQAHDNKHRFLPPQEGLFKKVVKGRIDFLGMVKGENDSVYIKYREKLGLLAAEFFIQDIKALPTMSGAVEEW